MAATVARPRPRGGERLLDVDGLRTPGAGAQARDLGGGEKPFIVHVFSSHVPAFQ